MIVLKICQTEELFTKLEIYNVFKNFNDLQNEIFVGLRFGNSKFDKQLNSFKIHNLDNYWNQNLVEQQSSYDNLSASWIEFVVILKLKLLIIFTWV